MNLVGYSIGVDISSTVSGGASPDPSGSDSSSTQVPAGFAVLTGNLLPLYPPPFLCVPYGRRLFEPYERRDDGGGNERRLAVW